MTLTFVVVTTLTSALAAMQASPAPVAQAAVVRVTQVNRPDGTQQIWEISQERLAALPPFNVAAPQVSLVEAVDVAQQWASRRNPAVKRWVPANAALNPLVRTDGGTPARTTLIGWHYMVQLAPDDGSPLGILPGIQGELRRVRVVVLMDRSVLEPRIVAGAPGTQKAPALVPGTSDVYLPNPGTGVVSPQATLRPVPRYTPEALRRRIQGDVALQCVVDTDGRCQDITVIRSLDKEYGLDEQAVNTLREWRFTPGTLNGKPVKVRVMIEMSFNVRD